MAYEKIKIQSYLNLVDTEDESLPKHDDKYHDGHYTPGEKCERRERMKAADGSDTTLNTDSDRYQGMTKSKSEVRDIVRQHLDKAAEDIGIRIVDFEIHGSRGRGTARSDSDLDVVFEYDDGDGEEITTREDSVFNSMANHPLEIDGIKVDFNPINANDTGTLEDYMARDHKYDQMKVYLEKLKKWVSGASTDALGEYLSKIDGRPGLEEAVDIVVAEGNRRSQIANGGYGGDMV